MNTRKSITFNKPQIPYIDEERKKLGVSFGEMVRRMVDFCKEHRENKNGN